MRKLLVIAAVLWSSCFGAINIASVADVSGDGASHQIASSGTARWVQIVARSTNASVVIVGDSAITTTRGVPIAPGGGFMFPASQNSNDPYPLSSIYYLAQTGDKVSILWAK